MIDKDKILQVLKLVSDTMGYDYDNQKDCKEAIHKMITEVNLLRSEIEEKPIYHYYTNILEHLLFPQGIKYTKKK